MKAGVLYVSSQNNFFFSVCTSLLYPPSLEQCLVASRRSEYLLND